MYEQSKAAKRRYDDGAFHSRYFTGQVMALCTENKLEPSRARKAGPKPCRC